MTADAAPRAPRVLVLGTVLDQSMSGVRRHNQELLPRVAKRLSERGGSLAVLEPKTGIAVELPPTIERIPSVVPSGPPIVRATLEGRTLRRVLGDAREAGRPFDLVHSAHLPFPRHLGVPHTFTVHDLRALELEHTPLSRRLFARGILRHAVEGARSTFTVSEDVRDKLVVRYPSLTGRVHVVGNGWDHFAPLPRQQDARECGYLLHVGHLERRKNLELLLHALALDPTLPRLVLAGAPRTNEDEALRSLARELGVEARVELRGGFDDAELPALYAGAACVVLPSRLEGFGIPAVEAIAAGVPLCVSRTGALPEVAGPGAPTFDPASAEELASAVHAALEQGPPPNPPPLTTWDVAAERWFEGWMGAVAPASQA